MIDKILEILFECLPYDPDQATCFVDAVRLKIAAKEIEKLYSEVNTPSYPCFSSDITATDCSCRHCQPDRWMLDTDRDIWIRKLDK